MTNSFADILQQVQSKHKLHVWSLIITVFGDAIVPRGGAVSAQTVQSLLRAFKIEPGAVRTAFSRLTNDGWVIREKQGRNSFYRLSDEGYEPFAKASTRIYAAPLKTRPQDNFVIAIAPSDFVETKIPSPAFVSKRVQIFQHDDPKVEQFVRDDWFVIDAKSQTLPKWVHTELLPVDLARGFKELTDQFEYAHADTPIEAIALRTLLIHEWRRLLLRTSIIPPVILPDDWPVRKCRRQVVKTYERCRELSETWLSEHGTGPDGPLPRSSAIGNRFK